jgi:pseudaminic acid cytidylyltransferase
MTESFSAVVPAQGFDKVFPGRNLLPFNGGSLLTEKIRVLQKSNIFDAVIVSTEDDNIAKIAKEMGAQVHYRSTKSAESAMPFNDLVVSVSESLEYDHLAWCPVTAPLISTQDFVLARQKYFSALSEGYDSLITGIKEKRYLLDDSGPLSFRFDIQKRNRDSLPLLYEFVNAISIAPRTCQLEWGYNWGHRPFILELPKERSMVICNESDYRLAKYMSGYSA